MQDISIHPTSVIEKDVRIGEGTKVWLYTHIMEGAHIGKNCQIGQNVYIGRRVRIGNGVKIQNNVSVYEDVELEDDVFCGPSCVFTNVINPRSFIPRKHEFQATRVRQGASLGANATIICGITIGRYSFVGAGSVVTKDVADHALVMGVPARFSGWVCYCGVRLNENRPAWKCPACRRAYTLDKGVLREHG